MDITASMVKELREMTGAGMSACKSALVEADGDMTRANELLREKGLTAAAKKSGRIASEGMVLAVNTPDNHVGAVVEVNIETDFAAKNEQFRDFVKMVAEQALVSCASGIDGLLAEPWKADKGITVKDAMLQKIAIIGENINIRRFERYEVCCGGVIVNYIHGGGKVAVMMELSSDTVNDALMEAGRNVCMQVAAMSPKFVSRADVSDEFIAKEREILTQQAINEGKAKNIAEKIVEGRLAKELKEFCLLDQEYVKDSDLTVDKYLKGVGAEVGSAVAVKRFVRYETGEGIEKKEENFAEEVSKAMQV